MFHRISSRRGSAGSVVVVVIVLALLAGGLWYFVLRSTPEKTVTNLLEAVRLGDEQMAAAYLTEASAVEGNLVMGLTRRLAGEPTGEPQYTVGEAAILEDRATVAVEFPVGGTFRTLTGVESFTMPYVLQREGQTWLVDVPETQEEVGREITGGALDILRRFISPDDSPDDPTSGDRHI
ncbi:MAG: hypothetical protein ACOCX2_03845 [Armatimonadota bacterium]